MTTIKKLEQLPYIDITVRLYETSLPYKTTDDGSKHYYATFKYQDCCSTVTNNDGTKLGEVIAGLGGLLFIQVNGREFCLPPDDIWYNVVEKIGFVIPDVPEKIENVIDNKIDNEIENELLSEEIDNSNEINNNDNDNNESEEKRIDNIFPPDWNLEPTGYSGGNLKDIPEPHYWYWPDAKKKRRVDIRITRYYGIGKHYFVSIQEESNYIWNAINNNGWPPVGWIKLWDNGKETGQGLNYFDFRLAEFNEHKNDDNDDDESFMFHYNSYFEAKTICDKIIEKYFPKETHEIVWDVNVDELYEQHFYREGD